MSFDTLGELNWLAVVVATIAFFGLGAIWYAPPVFGRAWQRAVGFEMPEGERPGPAFYIGPLATCFLATVATGMLALATASDTLGEAIALGLVVGLGIAATGGVRGGHVRSPQATAAGVVRDLRRLPARGAADRGHDRLAVGLARGRSPCGWKHTRPGITVPTGRLSQPFERPEMSDQ